MFMWWGSWRCLISGSLLTLVFLIRQRSQAFRTLLCSLLSTATALCWPVNKVRAPLLESRVAGLAFLNDELPMGLLSPPGELEDSRAMGPKRVTKHKSQTRRRSTLFVGWALEYCIQVQGKLGKWIGVRFRGRATRVVCLRGVRSVVVLYEGNLFQLTDVPPMDQKIGMGSD